MFRKLLERFQDFPQPSDQVCNRCSTVYKVLKLLKIKISDDEIYKLHRMGALCSEVCGTSFPTVFLRDNFDALSVANETNIEEQCFIALHTASQLIGSEKDFSRVEELLCSEGLVCEVCLSNWRNKSVRIYISSLIIQFLSE